MTNSRNKGATFERQIAKELHLLTGITFRRDLEQYRAADHGDLMADDPAWPFLIECKARAKGVRCDAAWKRQAVKASANTRQIPCVVFKFNCYPVRCAVPFIAIAAAHGRRSAPNEWLEVSLDGLAYLAREIMAEDAEQRGNGA